MNIKLKQILAGISAISVLFTTSAVMPNNVTGYFGAITASAEQSGDGWSFDEETGTLIIITNDGTTTWGNSISDKNAVKNVEIQNGVTTIGVGAFLGCSSITSITIPESVTTIGTFAFDKCSNLDNIIYPIGLDISKAGIPDTSTKVEYLIDGDEVIITQVTPGTDKTSVKLPDTINGQNVTSIGESAMEDCSNLTSITLPNNITSIGASAFSGCSYLESITIPNSVTSIDTYAFYDCSSLTSITIPDSVESIGDYAFYRCSELVSVTMSDGVTSIGVSAFSGCFSLESVTIPDSVTFIGDSAFSRCSYLDTLIYPNVLDVIIADVPDTSTKVEYSVNENGITITNITLGIDKTSVEIPNTINGQNVTEVAENVRDKVSEIGHNHIGGTATCTQKAVCALCGKEYGEFFSHNLQKTEFKNPTCTENGNIAYWYCSDCDRYFDDENGENEIALADTVISAKGHTLTATAEKAPTCTENGNIAYWHCSDCDKYFSDKDCKNEIALADTVISAKGHTLTATAEKAPTCTENGNTAYWHCSDCDKYFSDKDCKNEIALADTIITTNGHNYVDGKCTECGAYKNGIGEHLEGYSLSLDGNIGVNFYMELDKSVIADENAYMQFTLPNGSISKVPVSEAKQQTVNENTYYVFSCEVAAKEMTDTITAQIIASDNKGEIYTYSVEEYIQYIKTAHLIRSCAVRSCLIIRK